MKFNTELIIILLVILLIASVIIWSLYSQYCRTNESFIDMRTKNNLRTLSIYENINTVNYHKPYTYKYLTSFERDTNPDNLMLAFFCWKTKGVVYKPTDTSAWQSDYDDVLEIIRTKCPCKTSDKVYDLGELSRKIKRNPAYPTNINVIRAALDEDLKMMCGILPNGEYRSSRDYSLLTPTSNDNMNKSIIAPVYAVIIQYPNKWINNSETGTGDYKYTTFDLESDKPRAYIRMTDGTFDTITDSNGSVDTKVFFVYPMYARNDQGQTPVFYGQDLKGTNCIQYNYVPKNIKLKDGAQPTIKGIIDMIKFFDGAKDLTKERNLNMPDSISLSINKDSKACFIRCNNDILNVCGCGTRTTGSNDPTNSQLVKSQGYKSFCKEIYDDSRSSSSHELSNYGLMYRINELAVSGITDIDMDAETEQKITMYVTKPYNNPCLDMVNR